ncbi:MAG TPA: transglycosylase SLT domain-containing protein [Vicinamibacterales bacterium]|jgi:soluble lytic murein transglycosylase
MRTRGPARLFVCAAVAASLIQASPSAAQAPSSPAAQAPPASPQPAPAPEQQEAEPLRPTVHAALPQNIDDYWFAPRAVERASVKGTPLAEAATAYAAGNYAPAASYARQALAAGGPLQDYARFYLGGALLRSEPAEAEKLFTAILDRKPDGYLWLVASLGQAEAVEARGDHAAAADLYEKLSTHKAAAVDDMLARMARAASAAGDRTRAAVAWQRVYYEFPLSDAARSAGDALPTLQDVAPKVDGKRDLGRALILFGAKRYSEARSAFVILQPQASGDEREVIDLRIAECDYFLKRYDAAREGVRPYLEQASRRAEAQYFYLSALRALGNHDEADRLTRALVDAFPDSTWTGEALNSLGTHLIVTNDDDVAAQTFKELYEKFPTGPYAERSAWKYGWRAYTTGHFADTVRVFESAAAAFPRSDYRPPFLYWAGRAREKLGQAESAQARLRLVYTDYMNSYYGRLAGRHLPAVKAAVEPTQAVRVGYQDAGVAPPAPASPPPNAAIIRHLLAAGLYDTGLAELQFAQKAWGTSPAIDATIAWIYHQKGDLRRAITVMRRAYPQFLAESGVGLPAEILQVIFPLTYWDAIKKNAALYELDPYLVASLILQESTFDPTAKSGANAYGLMQIVPATGRRLATAVGIRRFNTAMLTNGDTNIRLGTLYFKRLVSQFGGTYYALASYNAGENRVVRWKSERPSMDEDEFIDDIPFPETQNYVKRILGIAEDYRRLYGEGEGHPAPVTKAPAKKKSSAAKKPTSKKTSKKKKSGGA